MYYNKLNRNHAIGVSKRSISCIVPISQLWLSGTCWLKVKASWVSPLASEAVQVKIKDTKVKPYVILIVEINASIWCFFGIDLQGSFRGRWGQKTITVESLNWIQTYIQLKSFIAMIKMTCHLSLVSSFEHERPQQPGVVVMISNIVRLISFDSQLCTFNQASNHSHKRWFIFIWIWHKFLTEKLQLARISRLFFCKEKKKIVWE